MFLDVILLHMKHMCFKIGTEFTEIQKLLLRILVTGLTFYDLRLHYSAYIGKLEIIISALLSNTYSGDELSLGAYLLDYSMVVRQKHAYISLQQFDSALKLQQQECQFTDLNYDLVFSSYKLGSSSKVYTYFLREALEKELEDHLTRDLL